MILEIDGKKVRLHQGKCTVGCVDEHLLRRRRQPTLIEGHASAYKPASPNQSYQTTAACMATIIINNHDNGIVIGINSNSPVRNEGLSG